MRRRIAITILLSLSVSGAWAAPRPAGDPVEQVKVTTTRVAAIASAATEQSAMVDKIATTMGDIIDFEGFSARTLKGRWAGLTDAQKKRFMTAFRSLVTGTYAKRFKPGATFRVTYRGATAYSDTPTATVKTTIHGEKAAADVDYLFAPSTVGSGLAWRAIDIVIDEVSMARNWRGQFRRILDRDGFDVLITRIEKKANKRP